MSSNEPRLTPPELVVKVLRWIGILAVNPALGGGGIKRERLATLADRLATLIEGGSETWDELKEFAQQVRVMAETGAEPSEAQWAAMRARDAAVRATLVDRESELKARIAANDQVEADVAAEAERQRLEEHARMEAEAQEAERLRLEAEVANGPRQ